MNRRRKTHRGLPRRVVAKHGAYYFFAPAPTRNPWTGKIQTWIRLCAIDEGEPVMYSNLGELMGDKKLVDGTMPSLCADWKDRKLSRYSDDVQKEYRRMADLIATAFEDYTVAEVTTKDCADFLRDNFRGKPNTAQKYANVLRKIFKFAIASVASDKTIRAISSTCPTTRQNAAKCFRRMAPSKRFAQPR